MKVLATPVGGKYYSNVGFVWNNTDPVNSAPYAYASYNPMATGNVYTYTGGSASGITVHAVPSITGDIAGVTITRALVYNITTPYTVSVTAVSGGTPIETANSSLQMTSNLIYLTGQTASVYDFWGDYRYYTSGTSWADLRVPGNTAITVRILDATGASFSNTLVTTGFAHGFTPFVYGNSTLNGSITTPQLVLAGGTPNASKYQLDASYSGLYVSNTQVSSSPITQILDTIQSISFYSNGVFNGDTLNSDWNNTTGGTLISTSAGGTTLAQTQDDFTTHPRSTSYYYVALDYQRRTRVISGPRGAYTDTLSSATLKSNLVLFA